ncbi:hypothetical protein CASFOL_026766 [Castilleja foliolosa]|uniref:HMA domain-containing protein n=1 Tax=Castilleja foliolosa TaxID=1961234 RepID=A0ABD3CJT9_9LAMI
MGEKNTRNCNITVVLKADFHCEGCVSKVIKCIRSFDGVETVTIGEGQKITVVGNVDPAKLREKVERKTHKKVELNSPLPKEGKEKGGDNGKNEKPDQKKPKEKEIPVTTAVFKTNLHCFGCIRKIYKAVIKTKGYKDMEFDRQKDQFTVTGAIDMKDLAAVLSKKLKKEIVFVPPPKKEAGKKEKGGEKGKNGGDEKAEWDKMMQQQESMGGYPYPFMGGQHHCNPYPFYQVQAPQIFSDENPNACRVM